MKMKGGCTGTSEIPVTKLEGEIQEDHIGILKDHMTAIHMLQQEIEV